MTVLQYNNFIICGITNCFYLYKKKDTALTGTRYSTQIRLFLYVL